MISILLIRNLEVHRSEIPSEGHTVLLRGGDSVMEKELGLTDKGMQQETLDTSECES